MYRLSFSIIFTFSFLFINAQYLIEGKVNLTNDWQPYVYLAALDEWNDFFSASQQMILKRTTIDSNGRFRFSGEELPKTQALYRLYFIQEPEEEVLFITQGAERNHLTFIFSNADTLLLHTSPDKALLVDYQMESTCSGNASFEHLMKEILSNNAQLDQSSTGRARKLLIEKQNSYLKNIMDTSQNGFTKMLALSRLTLPSKEKEILARKTIEVLKNEKYAPKYAQSLQLAIERNNISQTLRSLSQTKKILWVSLGLNVIFLLLLFWKYSNQISSKEAVPKENLFTPKEQEILILLAQGYSNKEMANQLFVGLSTIKTHINNIYRKAQLKDRKEAISFAKEYFNPKSTSV
ncbi:MAG: LuxR C-terminal-related transcriptional regulator [Bacteroidota bacterium]